MQRRVTLSPRTAIVLAIVLVFAIPIVPVALGQTGSPSTHVWIDSPVAGATITNGTAVDVGGWAFDSMGPNTGIDMVRVYFDATMEANGTLLGTAAYGGYRPDVPQVFQLPAGFANTGYDLMWTPNANTGSHTLYVYAHSVANNNWASKSVGINVIAAAAPPTPTRAYRDRDYYGSPYGPSYGGGYGGSGYGGYGGASCYPGDIMCGGVGYPGYGPSGYPGQYGYPGSVGQFGYSGYGGYPGYGGYAGYPGYAGYAGYAGYPGYSGYGGYPYYGTAGYPYSGYPGYGGYPYAPTLAAPATLTATMQTSTTITLTWQALAGAARYQVYQSVGGSAFMPSVMSSTTTPTAVVSGLAPMTTYLFYVVGVDSLGRQGPPSPTIAAATTP